MSDAAGAPATPETLRTRVLRGGAYLVARQALGTLLGFVAVMLIVRRIGPAEYGLAATAVGLCGYALDVFPLGVGAYVIRHEGDVADEELDQAFTCLVLSGLAGLAIALAAVPALGFAMGVGRFRLLAAAAFAVIPVNVIGSFSLALLERSLEYRKVAFIEFTSQTTGHAVALALAFQDFGGAALVGGLWAKELVAFALLLRALKYRPRFRWEIGRVRRILRYGTAFGVAGWVYQAGDAAAPIIVSRLAGPEVLGVISLANRFIGSMNLVAAAARRLAFASLAKVQRDREKLARVTSEAMVLQVLTIGFLVASFGVGAHLVFPRLLDARWAGLLVVYPLLALATLANAAFSFHVQVLHVLERSWDVALYHASRAILLNVGLVFFLRRFGLLGYAYADLASAAIGFPLIHLLVARQGLRLRYGLPIAFQTILGCSLFFHELGWPLALAPLTIVAWPGTWRLVRDHLRNFRGGTRAAGDALAGVA